MAYPWNSIMAVFRLCQLEKSGHNWGVNSLILALWKEAKLTRMGRWHAFQGTCGHQGAFKWRRGPYAKMSVTLGLGIALACSGCCTGCLRGDAAKASVPIGAPHSWQRNCLCGQC